MFSPYGMSQHLPQPPSAASSEAAAFVAAAQAAAAARAASSVASSQSQSQPAPPQLQAIQPTLLQQPAPPQPATLPLQQHVLQQQLGHSQQPLGQLSHGALGQLQSPLGPLQSPFSPSLAAFAAAGLPAGPPPLPGGSPVAPGLPGLSTVGVLSLFARSGGAAAPGLAAQPPPPPPGLPQAMPPPPQTPPGMPQEPPPPAPPPPSGSPPVPAPPATPPPTPEEAAAKAVAALEKEREEAAAKAAEAAEDMAIPEVPKCHLHRKANKACKFCKAHATFMEQKSREMEEQKKLEEQREKLKEGMRVELDQGAKVPLPNLSSFPSALRERLLTCRNYSQVLSTQELPEVKEALKTADTCEPESRNSSLESIPSTFICCVYRLLNLKLTEGQLAALLNNRNQWVRCAGFLFVRFGVSPERYWDLLSEHLMDDEEFVPFPNKDGLTMTEGQYVEHLLSKEKYCDLALPRIAAATKRTINERVVLYDQFRKRYSANLDVLDRFEAKKGGLAVEVCTPDGEWVLAETLGSRSPGRKRVTVPVRLLDGNGDLDVSIGMIICPDKARETSGRSRGVDLTSSRGKSNKELLEEYRLTQRDAAVASGKDYCKSSGRHTVHAGGVTFVCGAGADKKQKADSDSEEERAAKRRKDQEPSREHQAKMAAIMEKYLRPGSASRSASGQRSGVDIESADRMRLG